MNDPRHPTAPAHPQHASPHGPPHASPHPPQQVHTHGTTAAPASHPAHGLPRTVSGSAVPKLPQQKLDELDPIELIEDESSTPAPGTSKIKAFGAETAAVRHHQDWKRKVNSNGTGATRVRSFHGKYSDTGIEYLDNAINEWLDNHPEAEVKFVTSTVGVFEGKIREPALVLNLWY